MIISASELQISYQNLEDMFNRALQKEILEWRKEKDEFFEDPFNDEGRATGKYMPSPVFQIWLKLPKNLVSYDNLNKLLFDCSESGWEVESKWQENERTGEDQIYFLIKKMN